MCAHCTLFDGVVFANYFLTLFFFYCVLCSIPRANLASFFLLNVFNPAQTKYIYAQVVKLFCAFAVVSKKKKNGGKNRCAWRAYSSRMSNCVVIDFDSIRFVELFLFCSLSLSISLWMIANEFLRIRLKSTETKWAREINWCLDFCHDPTI